MKKSIVMLCLMLAGACAGTAQDVSSKSSCSVIVYNNKWLVKSYDKDEVMSLSVAAKGLLSVHETGDIALRSFKPGDIPFKVSILKSDNQTLVSYSEKAFKSVPMEEVLKKCKPGDEIFISLQNEAKFSLPHHRIKVVN